MPNQRPKAESHRRSSVEDTRAESVPMESAMGGAGDSSSGGGAAAGLPSEDLQIRTRGRVDRGDVRKDRKKIFPEAKSHGGTSKRTRT